MTNNPNNHHQQKHSANKNKKKKANDSNDNSPKRRGPRRRSHKKLYPQIKRFPDEQQQSKSLEKALKDLGLYDTEHGLANRRQGLTVLEETLNQWCESIRPATVEVEEDSRDQAALSNSQSNSAATETENEPQETQREEPRTIEKAKVTLVSFGSYRLGVHNPSADTDVVALCPPHCTREEFFSSLVELLEKDHRVTDLHPIREAYTPVIKFTLMDIAVDLLFVQLSSEKKLLRYQRSKQDAAYNIDDSDLLGLDEAGVRSLNGARVAQVLLETVPNLDHYRTTLRAVKEWATVHGLYSNVLGFLGGINYAILVACICRRHRDAKPATLLKAFFQTFANWNWPTPVTLGGGGPLSKPPTGVTPLPVWDGKNNPRDQLHLMPILTPAYPSMNSAYNVGIPQQRRMTREFGDAIKIIRGIEQKKNNWADLFVGDDFFQKHQHFLKVNIIAENAAAFLPWFRLVEARLRLLIAGLEAPGMGIQAEPFAKFFELKYDAKGRCIGFGKSAPDRRHEACFFVALRFANDIHAVDFRSCVQEFLEKVNTWSGRSCYEMDLSTEMVLHHELPEFILDSTCCYHSDVSGSNDSDEFEEIESDNSSAMDPAADDSSQASDESYRQRQLPAKVVPVPVATPDSTKSNPEAKTKAASSVWADVVKKGEKGNNKNSYNTNNYNNEIQSPTKRPRT